MLELTEEEQIIINQNEIMSDNRLIEKEKYVWNPRKQSMGDYPMLVRMFKVTPKGGKYSELYQLRTLLTKRPGIGSFEELRTYNGKTYNTFLETAIAMNLLKEDAELYRSQRTVVGTFLIPCVV